MKKSIFIGSVVLTAILFFSLGYFIDYSVGNVPVNDSLNEDAIVQRTKKEIRNRLIELGLIETKPEEIKFLSGEVTKIGDNYFFIKPSIDQDMLGDIFPEEIKILVDQNSDIQKWSPMSYDEYQEVLKDYEDLENADPDNRPEPVYKERGNFKDIKVGYYIYSVTSNNNIKGVSEFVAQKIGFKVGAY